MVLTALLAGQAEPVELVHMTVEDITDLRRQENRARYRHREKILRCCQCGGPLHPVHYATGLDIFRHDPHHAARCAAARGESARHELLKTVICRAADRVPGWAARVEVPLDGTDPDTGRPPIVDVVARPDTPGKAFGWEVQLSPETDAHVLNRHQLREALLARCVWVTPDRPIWSNRLPWLQTTSDGRRHLVAAGIVEWRDGDYLPVVEPETLTQATGDVLRRTRRQLVWTEGVGWWRPQLDPSAPKPVRVARPTPDRDHNPATHCDRDPVPDRLWRPVPNLPNVTEANDSEYREAMAAALADYRAAPHVGPPADWTPEAAEARIRIQALAGLDRYRKQQRERQ